jgi:hypothetical protein
VGGQRELPGGLAERVLDGQAAIFAFEIDAVGGVYMRLDRPWKAVAEGIKIFLKLSGILLA